MARKRLSESDGGKHENVMKISEEKAISAWRGVMAK